MLTSTYTLGILLPQYYAHVCVWVKPGFHYPSWRPTDFHYPSTRLCWWVMETGHPSTPAVNSGSGNQALDAQRNQLVLFKSVYNQLGRSKNKYSYNENDTNTVTDTVSYRNSSSQTGSPTDKMCRSHFTECVFFQQNVYSACMYMSSTYINILCIRQ